MKKADASNAKIEEILDFKVIEFNKDSKKIVVSHTRTFEEGDNKAPVAKSAVAKKGGAASSTAQAVKTINPSSEKSTLDALEPTLIILTPHSSIDG